MNEIEMYNPFNAPVYYKEETASTMSDMAQLDNPAHGTVIMTGYQSNGKGRGQNRIWKSHRNENLLFTIALNPGYVVHPMVRVPLICGLALNRYFLSEHKIKSELKWPNDLLVKNRKISGILCEYRNGFIHAGIGINCLTIEFDEDVKFKATSMKLQDVPDPYPRIVLGEFLPFLKESLEEKAWKNHAERILYGLNREIEVLEGPADGQIRKKVLIKGLNDDGMLLIEEIDTRKKRALLAGEISFPEYK